MDDSERRNQLAGIRDAIQKGAFQPIGMNEAKRMLEKHLSDENAKDDTVTISRIGYEGLCASYDRLHARVAELEPMAECAAIMAVSGYFSRMRRPAAWLDHGSWDEYPELFACAGVDLRSFQHGTRFYAGSAPVPAAQAEAKVADGWVLVPREPTEEMVIAALKEVDPLRELIDWTDGHGFMREDARRAWSAMLAAKAKVGS